jgi:hypothetical protein
MAATPPRRPLVALWALLLMCLLVLMSLSESAGGLPRSYAAGATPPIPPTFVPTPIGSPPAPPTLTPSPAPAISPTPAGSGTASALPTSTTLSDVFEFSMDAARVARPGNPGNFSGLAAVKPSSTVWLMMYYTVSALPRNATRITTYQVTYQGRVVFKVAYKTSIKKSEIGRFSRYQVFTVPRTLPYGKYLFKASLSISDIAKSRGWHFAVGKKEVLAKTSGRP